MNIFAIGDIHGSLKELRQVNQKIFNNKKFNEKEDLIIYLGDYIDRGLKSKDVIDELIDLKKSKLKTIFLKGNHDEFMIDFITNSKNNIRPWLNFGVDQTFRSYNIELVKYIKDGFDDQVIDKLRIALLNKMNSEHINFFNNLKSNFSTEKYLFVHAGVDPDKKLIDQVEQDFLWSRSDKFLDEAFKFEKIVVHGHTPENNIVNHKYRINIDTGCYFSGKLSCVILDNKNENRVFLDSE